eukprot:3212988-Amphidinium_carterae.1
MRTIRQMFIPTFFAFQVNHIVGLGEMFKSWNFNLAESSLQQSGTVASGSQTPVQKIGTTLIHVGRNSPYHRRALYVLLAGDVASAAKVSRL